MTRGGRTKTRDGVERRCIASAQTLPIADLVRFVLSPDGIVTPDFAEKLPGRGMWVCAERKILEDAVKKNAFSRSAKAKAEIPDDLVGMVITLATKRLIDTLSLCRKAGVAVVGYDMTKTAISTGKARQLIQAYDGSERQKSKIRPLNGENPPISCLNSVELGLAFAREHVIHAALMPGALTARAVAEANRLSGLRGETIGGADAPRAE